MIEAIEKKISMLLMTSSAVQISAGNRIKEATETIRTHLGVVKAEKSAKNLARTNWVVGVSLTLTCQ